MIEVQNLRKSFGDIVAVDGVTFGINSGEAFGLLGPNGAGKTTTINMMVGILPTDQGSVSVDGAEDPTRPAVRCKFGIAPQSLSLYDNLTAQENLAFFGKLYGLHGSRLQERVDWALELASLEDRRKHRVKTFSGGMQRRLNLAAALVHEPEVLFLDEPTVGVDPQSRNHIFEQIQQLKSGGLTIIYTTHYMEEAARLCDRVAIIDHGKLLALDTVPNLIDAHGGESLVLAELAERPSADVKLPGELDDLSLRFQSPQPLAEVGRLSAAGVEFSKLQVTQPDLEAVFLNLTGRRLRD